MKENMIVEKSHAAHGHKKGGMSQNRFMRLQEEAKHHYLKAVAERARSFFAANPVDHILVGGPGLLKDEFIDKYLDADLKARVIYVADTSNGGRDGVRDILQKAKEAGVLEQTEYMKERKTVDKFIELVTRDSGLAEYGLSEVMDSIQECRAAHIIASEKLGDDVITTLATAAKTTGAEFSIVSTTTEEGAMFLAGFTGIGAFLRWKKQT